MQGRCNTVRAYSVGWLPLLISRQFLRPPSEEVVYQCHASACITNKGLSRDWLGCRLVMIVGRTRNDYQCRLDFNIDVLKKLLVTYLNLFLWSIKNL